MPEHVKGILVEAAKRPKTPEHRRRIGEANRGRKRPWTPEWRERCIAALLAGNKRRIGQGLPEGTREKLSTIAKERLKNLDYRDTCIARLNSASTRNKLRAVMQTPEYRKQASELKKKQWQDPEFIAKWIAGVNRKPTDLERKLDSILQQYFPEFKYNGDFSLGVTLGGLVPDFVNVNGKKEVIEAFGDYYHRDELGWRRSELGKIMIYNSLGYRCLVLWEHELKTLPEEQIVEKIHQFTHSRGERK